MKFRGFSEDYLSEAYDELKGLGLPPFEIYPVIHLAGAKWRAEQMKAGKDDEIHDRRVALILHNVTIAFMQACMQQNQVLAKLGHTEEFDRFMLLAVGISFNELARKDSPLVGPWIRSGNLKRRRTVLAFSIGANIVVEADAIDPMLRRIVEARYGHQHERGRELADSIIAFVDRVGNAGYACLNPIAESS